MNLVKLFKDLDTGKYVITNELTSILCPFQYVQSTPSPLWKIIHNRNTYEVLAQVFVNNRLIKPDSISFPDVNTIEIGFSVPVEGFVNIATYTTSNLCVPLTPTVTSTTTPTATLTQTPTLTPTVTPTISVTASVTQTPAVTTSFTPTLTVTPTVS